MAMQVLADTRQLDAQVAFTNMSNLLAGFRKYIEREAGVPIQRIELNGALILHDLCKYLDLGAVQRERILGKQAAAFVDALLAERIDLR